MTAPDDCDHLDRLLAALPASAAGDACDARVRVRCHTILAARRTAASRTESRAHLWKPIVTPILVGAFCTLYFSALVWRVLH